MFLERSRAIRGDFGGFKDAQLKKNFILENVRALLPARKCDPHGRLAFAVGSSPEGSPVAKVMVLGF